MSWRYAVIVLVPGFLSLVSFVLAWKYYRLAGDWERMAPYLTIAKEEAEVCRAGAVGTIVLAVLIAAMAIFNGISRG